MLPLRVLLLISRLLKERRSHGEMIIGKILVKYSKTVSPLHGTEDIPGLGSKAWQYSLEVHAGDSFSVQTFESLTGSVSSVDRFC